MWILNRGTFLERGRRVAVSLSIILALASPSFGEGIGNRLRVLEERIASLEEVIRQMSVGTVTIDKDTPVFVDTAAPSEGDVKAVVGSLLSLNAADSTTNWSVVSGAGDLSLEQSDVFEGAGAIKFDPSQTGEHVIKFTINSTDLTNYHGICFAIKKVLPLGSLMGVQVKVSMTDDGGERGPDSYTAVTQNYKLRWFNISSVSGGGGGGGGGSGFTAAQKDAITEVKFTLNVFDSHSGQILIDYVVAQTWSKPQIAYPERTATLSPPYSFNYTATATDPRTITLPRPGTIKALLIAGDEAVSGAYFATSDMSGKAKLLSATAVLATGQITSMGDGTFTVSGNLNNNGTTYYGLAFFED